MSDSSELQAKILEWQRRYNIEDGDPAMALIELLNIYGYRNGATSYPVPVPAAPAPVVSTTEVAPMVVPAHLDDAVVEQIRSQLFPAIERLGFQTQELKQKVEVMALETFSQQVATYHEGIDYCTKKLDVVKKDSDALVVQLSKVANSIAPITRLAVLVLVLVAFVLGFVAAVAFYK
ncbi:MAG TPA: hypothetical protein VIM61_04030 [Chthoniobacterales bacterium]|jgi:hypothetical protein